MLLGSLIPIGIAYLGKLIIDAVVLAGQTGLQTDRDQALKMVALELALMLVFGAITFAQTVLQTRLETRVAFSVNERILEKALTLDLAQFEDSSTYDRLQNARREAGSRPLSLFTNLVLIAVGIITLGSYAAILIAFQPWAVLALVLASLPAFFAETTFSAATFRITTQRAPEQRRMGYLENLLTNDVAAKEIKLYGFGRRMIERYDVLFAALFKERRALELRRAWWSFGLSLLSTAVLYGYYAYFVTQTISGALTLGDLALYMTVFRNGHLALRNTLRWVGATHEAGLFMSGLFGFLDLPVAPPPPPAQPVAGSGFVLENVSFVYPGAPADRPALSEVSLKIMPGEKLAIVGENGAGKSTLVKLIAGLYRPSTGALTLDGIAPELQRARFGVVLQDFVRYQFTARDNVALGELERAAAEPESLQRAAEKAGADATLAKLPHGWETQLGRYFENGTELSLGNWQKLALARAFLRDSSADILILDEPTASLDAAAEHALFEKFRALAEHKTAILVSHRFSTVRMADRIAVVAQGKIVELGSHEELLAKNGRYAQLFRLQAEGYLR